MLLPSIVPSFLPTFCPAVAARETEPSSYRYRLPLWFLHAVFITFGFRFLTIVHQTSPESPGPYKSMSQHRSSRPRPWCHIASLSYAELNDARRDEDACETREFVPPTGPVSRGGVTSKAQFHYGIDRPDGAELVGQTSKPSKQPTVGHRYVTASSSLAIASKNQ